MPREKIVCPQMLSGQRHFLQTNWKKLIATSEDLDLVRCTHRPSRNEGECAAEVIVLALPMGWHYVAIMSQEEFRRLEAMSGADSMAYLLTGTAS